MLILPLQSPNRASYYLCPRSSFLHESGHACIKIINWQCGLPNSSLRALHERLSLLRDFFSQNGHTLGKSRVPMPSRLGRKLSLTYVGWVIWPSRSNQRPIKLINKSVRYFHIWFKHLFIIIPWLYFLPLLTNLLGRVCWYYPMKDGKFWLY